MEARLHLYEGEDERQGSRLSPYEFSLIFRETEKSGRIHMGSSSLLWVVFGTMET
jgi:hypothetical protein